MEELRGDPWEELSSSNDESKGEEGSNPGVVGVVGDVDAAAADLFQGLVNRRAENLRFTLVTSFLTKGCKMEALPSERDDGAPPAADI